MTEPIKIAITILSPIAKVWEFYNDPAHIINWNFAHESWHCPNAKNDLKVGGEFNYYLEARDQSFGFNLKGVYDEVLTEKYLRYHFEDHRNVEVYFQKNANDETTVVQIFDSEDQNSLQMQREGWFAILKSFKNYVENRKDK